MSEEHKKIAPDSYDDAKDFTYSSGKLFEIKNMSYEEI